jgi:branched-chain amino acid aminotransferase
MADLKPSKWIWMDDQLVPWADAKVHVASHVLHYGTSVFEGIRAYDTPKGRVVLGLPQHLRRFEDSGRILNIPLPHPRERLAEITCELIRANEHRNAYVRPLLFRGHGGGPSFNLNHRKYPAHLTIFTVEWEPYMGAEAATKGVDACVSSWRRMAPDTHPAMAKAGGNYINSSLAMMEAVDNGYTESIFLDVQGFVSEANTENIFVVRGGVAHTPPLANSILGGVTRGFVMQLCQDLAIELREVQIPREMLYTADEVFVTGTAAEVVPIRSVDRRPIGAGTPGPMTQRLQKEYRKIINGDTPDRHGWLTPVDSAAVAAVPVLQVSGD